MAQAAPVTGPNKEKVLAKALLRSARVLGLKNVEIGRMIGTSPASVSRMSQGRGLDPRSKEGELALLFLRMFRSLDALMGGDETRAKAWFQAHNKHLSGTPAKRVVGVQGLVETIGYLDALRGNN